MKPDLYLSLAFVFEVFGSSCLLASRQLCRFWPPLGFGGGFWFFMQVLKCVPLGVTYALWAGLGICLVTAVGWLVFGQRVDLPALAGVALIIAGIAVINLMSKTVLH